MHPSGLRRVTERRVAHVLLRDPKLSRLELARLTGLSVATVGKIIDALVAAGVVEKLAVESGASAPTLGRPADYFGLMRSRLQHVAVELGVNQTRVAALPVAGPIGDVPRTQFRTPSDTATFLTRVRAAIADLEVVDHHLTLVSVPGVVDERNQRVLYSPNLHWTVGTELLNALAEETPGQLVAVQEVEALALGRLVHEDPNDSFLLIETCEGVGGALVIEGRLQNGPLPMAAEIGHTTIRGNRRRCGCGAVGCLETILGRRGLVQTAQRQKADAIRSWADLVQSITAGEESNLPHWLERILDDAAGVIAGALNAVGVSKVVLVGDLLELGPAVLAHISDAVNARALWGRFGSIRVEGAPRQRLLGLTRAALDRVILAPTPVEEAYNGRVTDSDAG